MLLPLLFLAAQLQIGSDEVSVHSSPYTPSISALASSGVIRTQVDLVEVPVVVRDNKGLAVRGLKQENFEVLDSGKKREIVSFSVNDFGVRRAAAASPSEVTAPTSAANTSETPRRFIALILDDLNSDFASLRRAKTAAAKFVATSLAPGDSVAIFTTALAHTAEFTGDKKNLQKTIEAVLPHPRFADNTMQCPVIHAYEAYLIVNRIDAEVLNAKSAELVACRPNVNDPDSVVRSMSEGIYESARGNTQETLHSIGMAVAAVGKLPGQRTVLLTSTGFLTGGVEQTLQDLATVALHSGVIIDAMDLKGLYAIVPGGDAGEDSKPPTTRWQTRGPQAKQTDLKLQTRMEEVKDDGIAVLASATGGRFYQNNNDLAAGFKALGELPEVIYVLGISSTDVPHDGKFHPLKVRLVSGHGAVQARMGYNALPKELPRARDVQVLGTATPSDVAARITATPVSLGCSVRAEIDLSRLNFQMKQGRRTQHLTVIAALLDRDGNFVTGKQGDADLALTDPSFATLAQAGLGLSLSLSAAPGNYTMRVVVEESLTGKSTAVTRSVALQ